MDEGETKSLSYTPPSLYDLRIANDASELGTAAPYHDESLGNNNRLSGTFLIYFWYNRTRAKASRGSWRAQSAVPGLAS